MTSEQVGKILCTLRKERNISQERFAEVLGIPRPSVSQIENGKRELSFKEMQKVLRAFEISFEEVVLRWNELYEPKIIRKKSINMNIHFMPERFKQLLLYILEKCGGKPNVGETVLYKLLYFCDFNFFELYEKPLTGMKYRKMQYGPVPDQKLYHGTIASMEESGILRKVVRPYVNDTVQTRYMNFVSADMSVFCDDLDKAIRLVDAVIDRLSNMSARQIEDHSHGDYPWQSSQMNHEIDYSLVFSRTGEFAQRDYDAEFIQAGATDVTNDLPPLSKEEYEYYMSLPD